MFCGKCGNETEDGALFCSKCGNKLGGSSAKEKKAKRKSQKGKIVIENEGKQKKHSAALIVALLLIAALLIGGGFFLYKYFSNPEIRYKQKLIQAEKYLSEDNYEKAVAAYKAAIKISPKSSEAYKDLAALYIENNEVELALDILEQGIDKTDNRKLKRLYKKVSEGELSAVEETLDDEDLADNDAEPSSDDDVTQEKAADDTVETAAPLAKVKLSLDVHQVDNSLFPLVTFYLSATDQDGNPVDDLSMNDLKVTEINEDGDVSEVSLSSVHKVLGKDFINVNLVMDASGSMQGDRIVQAKNAAISLFDYMDLDGGDRAEVISFDDYVYMEQGFTSDYDMLSSSVSNISVGGSTALYDAIYSGVLQTYEEDGAKCVIAFTDGAENASSYEFGDVVDIARNTGIPVYIIGIGDDDYDAEPLHNLASACSGRYYSADDSDIEEVLKDIYISIYTEQQNYYVVDYTSKDKNNKTSFRDLVVDTSDSAAYSGHCERSYVPEADISGAFSSGYMDKDEILSFSSSRALTEADIKGLSLAELRIARNEIFARHGRQFNDPLLNQWFYSKNWYLMIPAKYAPDYFDKNNPDPLSKLEQDNANLIKEYEKRRMDSEDIYPSASTVRLSEYDLALSKPVLKTALAQMAGYKDSDILRENMAMVQDAIDNPDVSY